MRLQKILAQSGVCSRRQAEVLINDGKVIVNGEVATIGDKATFADNITVSGKVITKHEKLYYMFNKPKWTLTTLRDTRDRPIVMDYFKDIDTYLFPVGRLDFDTTGMLIITNDGEFAQILTNPRHQTIKTYEALVKGVVDPKILKGLEDGIQLTNYHTLPIVASVKATNVEKDYSVLEVNIFEGKKHEVKDIVKYLDLELLKLKRTAIHNLKLDSRLKPGEFRPLTKLEINKLLENK